MSKEEERLEERITIMKKALVTGASVNALVRKYSGNQSLISKWLRNQESIVHKCLVHVKLADE